jgi:hypothetical protein
MQLFYRIIAPAVFIFTFIFFEACTKKDIQFGNPPGETYTRVVQVDSPMVIMSTQLLDSFPTSGNSTYLLGNYSDPYLGGTGGKIFMQLASPGTATDIPTTAIYDSLRLIFNINKTYYGDTTKPQTIIVDELAAPLAYSFGNRLFNIDNFPTKPTSLGSITQNIYPNINDSIIIPLSNAKGLEFFNKIRNKDNDIASQDQFLNYFMGIVLRYANTDSTAIYALANNATNVKIRLFYHNNFPVPSNSSLDFPMNPSGISFNQLLTNRKGTPLATVGQKEFFSTSTRNMAFTQGTTGTLLKMSFPTVRNLLYLSQTVRLLKADLVVRPVEGTFNYGYYLPPSLDLFVTNGSNIIGGSVTEGGGPVVSSPFIDLIYRRNTNYTFTITSYISSVIASGSTDFGVFLMEEEPGQLDQINRAVIGDNFNQNYKTQLVLTLLLINE